MSMKAWRRIWHTSLRGKLIASVACCLLLTIGAGTMLSSWLTKDMMKETVLQNAGNSLDAANLYLTDQINRLIYISNYLYLDQELNLALKYRRSGIYVGQTEASDVTKKLDNLSYAGEQVYISVWTGNGKMVYSNFQSDQYQLDKLDIHQLTNSGSFVTGGKLNFLLHPSYLQSKEEPPTYMLSVARSLRLLSGKVYGYVIVSMNEEQLKAVLNKYNSTIQMMIVGADNKIISHPNNAWIGSDFTQLYQQREGILELERDMSVAGWRLEGLVPYGVAAEKINRIYQVTNFVQMAVLIVFLILLVLGIARLTRPIVKLTGVVRKIDNDNLSIRSGIRGEDEAGVLGQSLDAMLDRVEEMIVQIECEQSERRKAELEMLQAQINPHFLFNILGAIRMDLLLKGSEEAAVLLGSLSSLLRMTVNRGNECIPLQEEIETVQHYIRLVDFQREVKVHVEMELATDTVGIYVPRFIVQPLVENAYHHGLSKYGGILWIQSWLKDNVLWISIRDSGEGMNEERLQAVQQVIDQIQKPNIEYAQHPLSLSASTHTDLSKTDVATADTDNMSEQASSDHSSAEYESSSPSVPAISGIGLTNVIRRLQMIYGSAVQVHIESHPGEGTEIKIGLPHKQ